MEMKKPLAAPALFLFLIFSFSACSVINYERRQTTGSEVWYQGRLSSRIERPLKDVQSAAIAAYDSFGIGITKAANDQLSGVVMGELASGEQAVTEISSISAGQTEISIKIGGDGNEYISHRILEAIKGNLGSADLNQGAGPDPKCSAGAAARHKDF